VVGRGGVIRKLKRLNCYEQSSLTLLVRVGAAEGRRRFHQGVKQADNMSRPRDDYSVNPETGDVADPEGEIVGNLDEV
jgi:hypothetical protein